MKKLAIALLLISTSIFATENEIESTSVITKATVFLDGAQVSRESNVTLKKGKTIVRFKELSPYIDKNSIRVKGLGDFTIMAVNHVINHIDKTKQSPESVKLNEQIEELKNTLEYKKVELSILNEKKQFLSTNNTIISSDKSISPSDFKLFKEIFSSDFESLQLSILKKQQEINDLNEKIETLRKQTMELNNVKELPTSEISVTVTSKIETKAHFTIDYYVSNAGWFPSYDIRVDNINAPVKLFYKANVYQNTGVDWNNVALTFSNASPSESAIIPTLYPYFLYFNNYPQRPTDHSNYNPAVREVSGFVRDGETGEPIPFANVLVKGKTIGTTSDHNGMFTLSIPIGAKSLVVTFIGYEQKEVTISGPYLEIPLSACEMALEEVVLTDYSPKLLGKDKVRKESNSIPIDMNTADYKTNFEFNIDVPYTLQSKANRLTIEMKQIVLNSSYIYKSIPKLSQQAFLIANITDWEQHSLLDGEVNLYFEKTFVGKSVMDLSQFSDTLEVSLGADKNITIKREKQKVLTSKQFLGGNKIETRMWKTTIRNNKSEEIKIYLQDQVPISNDEKIVVETLSISDGEMDKETGKIVWEIDLAPKEIEEIIIEYKVKYPKDRFLIID